MSDVAFLVYKPLRQRRKDNSFDGNDNIGAKVIESVLRSGGINVSFCSPNNASKFRVVLVSMTSTNDLYAFYKAVAMIPSWQPGKRSFVVVAGGFGIQNPVSIRNYIDYAAFGRAHDWISQVVGALLGGSIPSHLSLMHLPDIHSVTIHQSGLYGGTVDAKTPYKEGFVENFTGCPLKCKFCHYTWARKYDDRRVTRGSYVQESLTGGGTPELTWDQLFTRENKLGRARVAIDGFSERLRWIYGKRITRDDIIGGVNSVGRHDGNATVLLVYNISNFPGETEADREELYETLRSCDPRNRVVFVLHSTPFRPSLATPTQWEGVNLLPDWSKLRSSVICEKANFRAVHSFTLETPYSHLMSVVAERATPETDKLFHAICFNSYLQTARHDKRLAVISREFDLSQYIREYDFEELHPAWFLSSYTRGDVIKRIAQKIRRDVNQSSNYVPTNNSLVKVRLNANTPS